MDSNYSDTETQESMIFTKTPETPPSRILKNNNDILINTPKCRTKNAFKMKIPLPVSPPMSPFLNDLQDGKLLENVPPDKNLPSDKNKLSPIFCSSQKTSDIFSSKVQGTKYSTTKVDGRTSENQKQMIGVNEKHISNNTSIIKSNNDKSLKKLDEGRIPFSSLSNKVSNNFKNDSTSLP